MPRKSRIDTPGALHHVTASGIEGRDIFPSDTDRDDFLERLGKIIIESHAQCYAWSIMPNHFHLLLETGATPLSTLMRKLMTGYAVSFNRRHDRRGHLFQNRYKSIICDKDTYLLELVRYIHLNPLRSGTVKSLKALDVSPFSGHGVILGKFYNEWQNCADILSLFDNGRTYSRRLYRHYVKQGIVQGRREELAGGGLLRSLGGWSAIKSLRKTSTPYQGDDRILGNSDFVASVLKNAQENLNQKYTLLEKGITFEILLEAVAKYMDLIPEDILGPGKNRRKVEARSLLCFWTTRELGETMTALADKMEMSVANISVSVQRGETIIRNKSIHIHDILNI